MITELERIWKDWRYYSIIKFEGLKKATIHFNQLGRFPIRGSNRTPPEHKSTVLPLRELAQ
jgi:hypothetical protein